MRPDGTYARQIIAPGDIAFDAQAEFLADAQRRKKPHTLEKQR
jgi:hypothetical protein